MLFRQGFKAMSSIKKLVDYGSRPGNKAGAALEGVQQALDNLDRALEGLTLQQMVDIGARLNGVSHTVGKMSDSIKQQLIAHSDKSEGLELEGLLFRACITSTIRWTLDVAAIKQEFGEQWCNARSKQAPVTSVRYKAR
jgi:hypothetical protein